MFVRDELALPATPSGGRRKAMPAELYWQKNEGLLRELFARNLSARQIAKEIGCTRNAVIGKCHRLGLVMAGRRAKEPAKVKNGKRVRVRTKKLGPAEIMEKRKAVKLIAPLDETKEGLPLFVLPNAGVCFAVIGRGPDGLARYCADVADLGQSFCHGHIERYYQPPEARRRNR